MTTTLPPVGTNALREQLSGHVPDDFIAELCSRDFTGGRRHVLSAAPLWRVHLLAVLTSTRSLNLIVAQLSEQPAWRRFGRLRRTWPTARMLHEFRQQTGVSGLRRINEHLLSRLADEFMGRQRGVVAHDGLAGGTERGIVIGRTPAIPAGIWLGVRKIALRE
jgi:hypothetical protein